MTVILPASPLVPVNAHPFAVLKAGYEISAGVVTKYYGVYPELGRGAGSQRIAMRVNGTLSFIFGDHLGSTSLTATVDINGNITATSEMRYKRWGEVRFGSAPTKYTFTGQRSFMGSGDIGLMFFNARMYDPALGRFISADSIVPPGVQGLDRYAYVANNPLRFTDPSGHVACQTKEDCEDMGTTPNGGGSLGGGSEPSYINPSQLTQEGDYNGEQLYQLYLDAWYDYDGWW